MSDTISKLKDLKELLDGGALTQAEFDAQKAQLLATPPPAPPQVMQPAAIMMQPGVGQASLGQSSNKPGRVPSDARGPITENYHGPTTDAFCCIMCVIGCWIITIPLMFDCGPGMDERDVWIGRNGEKYKYPTGELIPQNVHGGKGVPKPGQMQ